jgi:hypothetical protein
MTEAMMAITKSFKELVQRRVVQESAFAESLLREGIDTMLTGDIETGKAILRDYIKATVGFEKLGEATDTPAKSLIRMFSPRGNPQAGNRKLPSKKLGCGNRNRRPTDSSHPWREA